MKPIARNPWLLLLLAFFAGAAWFTFEVIQSRSNREAPPKLACARPTAIDAWSERSPVALNRSADILDGFRGDVHPFLHCPKKMEMAATWKFLDSRKPLVSATPEEVRELFLKLKTAMPTQTYSERDFSRFLPADRQVLVGQMWALDLDKVAEFLKQFHPGPSMRLLAQGRRPGPDGGFAVLRAQSSTHLDIVFRVHAEFDVLPSAMKSQCPGSGAWYSPACFLGRMVLDRQEGTVVYFQMGIPTGQADNVHVTHAYGNTGEAHGWMSVERMELTSGDPRSVEGISWVDQMETAAAHDQLTTVFYQFRKIQWVAFDKALAVARAQQKPILAVVALGALDDQTC